MNKIEVETFARSSINIIIQDIIETDVIIPYLIFDYSTNPNIQSGYYMYQNISGNIITLNMPLILELKNPDDIKTVITYGFIHEIFHMYQPISSKYKNDCNFYTLYEDTADYFTIDYIYTNKELIENKLHFKINYVFLNGIKRQLKDIQYQDINYDQASYFAKCITGALCNKLNYNFDVLYNLIRNNCKRAIKIIFTDKREYVIDIYYGTIQDLNLLINLIYLENNIKLIYYKYNNNFLNIYLY